MTQAVSGLYGVRYQVKDVGRSIDFYTQKLGDDDDSHLGDFIEDQSTLAPSDAATSASLRDVTKSAEEVAAPSRFERLKSFLDQEG